MIVIHPPLIEEIGDSAIISALLTINGKEDRIWYKFPQKLRQYLVTENLDAFLVGLLFLALKLNYNITLKAPVSAKLLYTLNNYLIPALVLSNPKFNKINILPFEVNNKDLNYAKAAGTGMSCGVDSLSTFYEHCSSNKPFKIEFLTFFNVGSHGDKGGDNSRSLFNARFENIKDFAQKFDMNLISIDSNLSELLQMNFQQTNTLRSISAVLNLQKLFKNYYYASAYRFDYFKISGKTTSTFDLLILNALSTESTTFYSSGSQFSRMEKIMMISNYESSYSFLDVCTNLKVSRNFKNCGKCEKCIKTFLTLELLNKLELYSKVVNLKDYHASKNKYIGKLLATKNHNPINREIYNLIRINTGFNFSHYFFWGQYLYSQRIIQFKNKIKRKLNYG